MLDKTSVQLINEFFLTRVELEPDFIFPGVIFDPVWRRENNTETPLLSDVGSQKDRSGAYVFFEPCNQDDQIEIMYVGRSQTLRNRITNHWGNYTPDYNYVNIMEEWYNYCWENDFPHCPYVAIFLSNGNSKDLEHWLMQLKPRFNTH